MGFGKVNENIAYKHILQSHYDSLAMTAFWFLRFLLINGNIKENLN